MQYSINIKKIINNWLFICYFVYMKENNMK